MRSWACEFPAQRGEPPLCAPPSTPAQAAPRGGSHGMRCTSPRPDICPADRSVLCFLHRIVLHCSPNIYLTVTFCPPLLPIFALHNSLSTFSSANRFINSPAAATASRLTRIFRYRQKSCGSLKTVPKRCEYSTVGTCRAANASMALRMIGTLKRTISSPKATSWTSISMTKICPANGQRGLAALCDLVFPAPVKSLRPNHSPLMMTATMA